MSVAAFSAWQECQAERYELVGGVPVRRIADGAWVKQRINFPARPCLVQDDTPGEPIA